jgi:YesN/AraC family two-component response regulator
MSFRYIVIDDAPFVCELIKSILKGTAGVCVGEAFDGEEGLKLFEKTLPDLVILDMVMPKQNGIELARKIREITYEVKIIACSTVDDDDIVQNAKDLGCDDYIIKPFTKKDFINVIKKFYPRSLEKT